MKNLLYYLILFAFGSITPSLSFESKEYWDSFYQDENIDRHLKSRTTQEIIKKCDHHYFCKELKEESELIRLDNGVELVNFTCLGCGHTVEFLDIPDQTVIEQVVIFKRAAQGSNDCFEEDRVIVKKGCEKCMSRHTRMTKVYRRP